MRGLLVLVGLSLLCMVLPAACESAPAGAGRADDSAAADGAVTGDEESQGDAEENGAPSDVPDDGGIEGGDDSADADDEASNGGTDEPSEDEGVDSDDAGTEDDSTSEDDGSVGGGGGGGVDVVGILPGEAAAGVEVGVFTKQDVEALYGAPAAPLPTVYQYQSLGITVWFGDSDVVGSVVLEAPYSGTTAGGNGIGGSLEAFRNELGNVDVPDQAGNFRVWEVAGLAVDFDADGLARAIQVFLPV